MIGERVEGRTRAAAGSCLGGDPRVLRVSHSIIGGLQGWGGFKVQLLFGLGLPLCENPKTPVP